MPLVQPDDFPNDVRPICMRPSELSCITSGPPESPLHVDLPPVVSMQILLERTELP